MHMETLEKKFSHVETLEIYFLHVETLDFFFHIWKHWNFFSFAYGNTGFFFSHMETLEIFQGLHTGNILWRNIHETNFLKGFLGKRSLFHQKGIAHEYSVLYNKQHYNINFIYNCFFISQLRYKSYGYPQAVMIFQVNLSRFSLFFQLQVIVSDFWSSSVLNMN